MAQIVHITQGSELLINYCTDSGLQYLAHACFTHLMMMYTNVHTHIFFPSGLSLSEDGLLIPKHVAQCTPRDNKHTLIVGAFNWNYMNNHKLLPHDSK